MFRFLLRFLYGLALIPFGLFDAFWGAVRNKLLGYPVEPLLPDPAIDEQELWADTAAVDAEIEAIRQRRILRRLDLTPRPESEPTLTHDVEIDDEEIVGFRM